MSSPNSVATAILANTTTTTTNGQNNNIDTNYYDAIGGIETPLTGGSLLSVSIGNVTDSIASSMISPRTGGRWGNRRDLPYEYSPTSGAVAGAGPSGGAQPPSWLTDDDDHHHNQYSERSSLHSELDTRPFPSFSRTSLVSGTGSIAPDSSFYSQLGRFQRVRNSVSLTQPWRKRRKDSTTTGSYATTTDNEEEGGDDASTISGSRHDFRQGQERQEQQQQYGRERERERERYYEREREEHDDATMPVDLFCQHQFIMPKPDETTPLIGGAGGDEENNVNCSPDADNNGTSPAALARRRSRLVLRLMLVALAGTVVVGGVLLVRFSARPPASGESQRTEE